MNHLTTSKGERITRKEFDNRIRLAKRKVLAAQKEDSGYIFCTKCRRNDDVPLDCAHIESVDSCIKNGYCEKAYNVNNITILGRKCHQKFDGLDLKFSKNE